MRVTSYSVLCAGTFLALALAVSGSFFEASQNTDCQCENGKCVTDYRGKTKCICKPKYVLQTEGVCKECYCGPSGKCYFERHLNSFLKKCLCDRGFAEKDGTCIDCQCGENSKCEFEGENKICYCLEGYADLNGVCTACDCGEYGECEFRNGKKHCLCAQNYLENNGKCEECDCGNGDCSFQGNRKVCKCHNGNSLKGDRCEACDCGPNSQGCSFDSTGKQVCACPAGYAQRAGKCAACDCGPESTRCLYDSVGKKVCSCKSGFAQNRERCEACNCGENSVSCSYGADGNQVCGCKQGYAQKGNLCTATCTEDDHCKNDGKCVNEGNKGSKFCRCKKGLKGDKCDIIIDCVNGLDAVCRNGGGVCKYDPVTEKAFCECPQGAFFNPVTKKCRACVCGENSISCSFAGDGSQVCRCKPGFAQRDKRCAATCTRDDQCKHGGKCVEEGNKGSKFCKCKNGLTGDNCDLITDCINGLYVVCRNGGGVCKYDPQTEKGYCECPAGKSFNPRSKKCEVCSCGENSVSCSFGDDGNEVCRCKPGYGQREKNTCSVSCTRDEDCKNGGKCVGEGRFGAKFCKCGKGLKGDKCEIVTGCDEDMILRCRGGGAVCTYNETREAPYCKCPEKQAFNPYSKMCEAGPCRPSTCFGGRCQRIDGELLCICPEGYRLEGIGCFGIMCKQTKCYGGVCRVVDAQEICTCYKGYVLKNDVCVLDFKRYFTS